MMKAKMYRDGKPVVVLGLSFANLDRLRADGLDGHILIKGEELEIDVDIVITAAATEKVMLDAVADGIREGTKLRLDPRFKS